MNHPAPPAQTRHVIRTRIRTHCMAEEVAQQAHPLRASAPLRAPCPRSCHWTQVAVAAREAVVKDALSICRRPALYSPTTPATRPAWWTSTSRERSTTAIRIRKVGTLGLIGPNRSSFSPLCSPPYNCLNLHADQTNRTRHVLVPAVSSRVARVCCSSCGSDSDSGVHWLT